MIAVEKAQSGHDCVIVGQRHLSSSIDPVAEARKWVDHYRGRSVQAQTLFVVGLGSGYHIGELSRLFPKKRVVVFEAEKAVIDVVTRLQSFTPQVEIVPVSSPWNNREDNPFAGCLAASDFQKPFAILLHRPSLSLHPELYQELLDFLGGRHPHHLGFYKAIAQVYEEVDPNEQRLSIYSVEKAIQRHKVLSFADRVWMTLRELVK